MTFSQIRLGKGDALVIDDVLYTVLCRDHLGMTLQSTGARRITTTKTHEDLGTLYFEGKNRLRIIRGDIASLPPELQENIAKSLDAFSPQDGREALRRLEYCRAMERFHARGVVSKTKAGYRHIAKLVARLRRSRTIRVDGVRHDKVPLEYVGWSTLRDWYWRYSRGKCPQVLVPENAKKGKAPESLDPEVEMVVAKWITERYLTLERPDLTVIYDLIVGDLEGGSIGRIDPPSIPSIDTVRRWVRRNVSEYEEIYYRKGREEAERKFRHIRRAPQSQIPLEVVEIDHTWVDLLLVDDDGAPLINKHGKVQKRVFRVWITTAICTATRMVLGWHISRDAPSWVSVMSCLRMSILPKDMTEYGCDTPHPAFGVPTRLRLDNGMEFHSNSLKAAAAELGMELCWLPRKKANLKGTVERLIGILNRDFLAFMGGRTFRDKREKGDYPSEKRAVYTLAEIQRLFGYWVGDIQHNRPRKGIDARTPLQRWEDLAGAGVNLPPTSEQLHAILALTVNRTVNGEGVTLLGLKYQSHEMQAMHRRKGHLGKKYMVKVDPLDIGAMLIMDDEKGRWLPVPAVNPELAEGVSLIEWRATVELARKRTAARNRVPLQTLRQARLALAEEARRKGTKPIRMKSADLHWFETNVDDPMWDLAANPGTGTEERERDEHRRRRGRKGREADPDALHSPRRVGALPAPAPVIPSQRDLHDHGEEVAGELIAIID